MLPSRQHLSPICGWMHVLVTGCRPHCSGLLTEDLKHTVAVLPQWLGTVGTDCYGCNLSRIERQIETSLEASMCQFLHGRRTTSLRSGQCEFFSYWGLPSNCRSQCLSTGKFDPWDASAMTRLQVSSGHTSSPKCHQRRMCFQRRSCWWMYCDVIGKCRVMGCHLRSTLDTCACYGAQFVLTARTEPRMLET